MALINAIEQRDEDLGKLSAKEAGQLDVIWHDCDPLSVNDTEVGALKQANQVGFASFLEGHDSGRLETEVGLDVLGDLTNKTLEGELADEVLSGLLIVPNFIESNSARAKMVGLLDSSSGYLLGNFWNFGLL